MVQVSALLSRYASKKKTMMVCMVSATLRGSSTRCLLQIGVLLDYLVVSHAL